MALPNQGQTVEVDLPRAGQVRVECDAHGWMLGWVYAVANPYYALTAEDGTFEITEVPPGNYTLIANQAYTGPVEVAVTVAAGQTAEVPVELVAPGSGRPRDGGFSRFGRDDGREADQEGRR